MKILIVLSSLSSGGAERVACNLAKGWIRRGYEVSLVTFGSPTEDFYHLDEGVKRISLNANRPSLGKLDSVRMNIVRVLSLRKIIKNEVPDLVVSKMTTSNVRVLLSLVGVSIPAVVAEHSYPPRSTKSKFWQWMRKLIYKRAESVVSLNVESGQWLRDHTSAMNVSVVPNAIVWPIKRMEPYIGVDSLPMGRKFFLGVGRLDHLKGFESHDTQLFIN